LVFSNLYDPSNDGDTMTVCI